MLPALGTEAVTQGYRFCYTPTPELVNEPVEAADEKQLNQTIARYGGLISSASTNSAVWNSTATARNASSRC